MREQQESESLRRAKGTKRILIFRAKKQSAETDLRWCRSALSDLIEARTDQSLEVVVGSRNGEDGREGYQKTLQDKYWRAEVEAE